MPNNPYDRLRAAALGESISGADNIFEKLERDRRRFDEMLGVRPNIFSEIAQGHNALQNVLKQRPTIFEDIARQKASFDQFVASGGLAAANTHIDTLNSIAEARRIAARTPGRDIFEQLASARAVLPDQVVRAFAHSDVLGSVVDRIADPTAGLKRRLDEQMEGISRLVSEVAGGLPSRDALALQFPDIVSPLRRPTLAEIRDVDLSSASGLRGADAAWVSTTAMEIAAIEQPWVTNDRPELAIAGYAAFKGLTETVVASPPADSGVTRLVRSRLGDYRAEEVDAGPVTDPLLAIGLHLAHGFDQRLSTLPVALAGAIFAPFGLIASAPDPDQDELDDIVSHIVRQLEKKLRAFINRQMTTAVGQNWIKQRVPKPLRDKWTAAREADLAAGRPAGELLTYADFGEYRSIIEQGDNWRDAFQSVFRVKTAIGETLARLSAIRNPSAHVRSMSTEDMLVLRVEGRRLYVWMGEIVP